MPILNPDGYPSQAVSGDYSQGTWANYEWIVVCGGLASFFMAWGIGANDVANSFCTSVGSKTLKLWQAVIIAGIMEFIGAMVLGGEVTKTIATDIANVSYFNNEPEMYMYGMLCALTVAGTWLLIATYNSLAVSTTHSIIGAVMGFAFVYGGPDAVRWADCRVTFPYVAGIVPVVISWFASPLIAGVCSSIIFAINRHAVLRRKNSAYKAMWGLPLLIFITFFINIMFVLSKGAQQDMSKHWPPVKGNSTFCVARGESYDDFTNLNNAAAWIGAVVGAGLAVISGVVGIPLMRRRLQQDMAKESTIDATKDVEGTPVKESYLHRLEAQMAAMKSPDQFWKLPVFKVKYWSMAAWTQLVRGVLYDIHADVSENATVSAIHEAAEVFDPHTEQVYKYLQVISSACVAFAHGANDVANAVGPFAAMWFVYNTWQIPSSRAETPKWVFVFGGFGIVLGLAMYGYNVMRELGVSLLKLTPSRGFSAELATGLTISLASFYGMPVSTTQTIVGAETGVGLVDDWRHGVNFPILAKTFTGWVFTIILAALFSAALFAMGTYSPSVHMAHDIQQLKWGIGNTTDRLQALMNTENLRYRNSSLAGTTNVPWNNRNTDVSAYGLQMNGFNLNTALSHISGNRSRFGGSSSNSKNRAFHFYVDPEFMVYWLNRSAALFINNSVLVLGQNRTAIAGSIRPNQNTINGTAPQGSG